MKRRFADFIALMFPRRPQWTQRAVKDTPAVNVEVRDVLRFKRQMRGYRRWVKWMRSSGRSIPPEDLPSGETPPAA